MDSEDADHEAWLCYDFSEYLDWERNSKRGQTESLEIRLVLVGTILPADEVNAMSQGVGLIQVEKGRLHHVARYGLTGLYRQWSWDDGDYIIEVDYDGYARYFEFDAEKTSRPKKSFKCFKQDPTEEEKRHIQTVMRERLEEYAASLE